MNPELEFPLVSFSDGCPVEKASMEEVDSHEALGLVCRREYSLGCPALKRTRFYSGNGFRYRVVGFNPEPKFSGLGKLMARLWHPWHMVKIAVRLENDGQWEVGPVKERIRGMLDHDPGDLLYQWTDEEDWNRGLASARTPRQLIDFLTKVALVPHDDESESED
jgi:hypothetical protein